MLFFVFVLTIFIEYEGGTPVFPSVLANLKRNSGDILVWVQSLLVQCILKQAQKTVELSKDNSGSRSEATSIRSIGHRLMIPYTREGMGKVRVDK